MKRMQSANSFRLASTAAFADRILHDLKQPLNVIRVVAQDVRLDVKRNRLDVDSVPASMAEVERAVDELTGRIDQLRAFGRRGTDTDGSRTVDLEQACIWAIRESRNRFPQARLCLELEGQARACAVPSHAVELALMELLDNAIRAAEESERSPNVRVTISHGTEQVEVSVADNGCGIAHDDREKMFEPFSTTWAGSGGLGLALATALASACGGRIRLASSDEQGSVFTLTVPR